MVNLANSYTYYSIVINSPEYGDWLHIFPVSTEDAAPRVLPRVMLFSIHGPSFDWFSVLGYLNWIEKHISQTLVLSHMGAIILRILA